MLYDVEVIHIHTNEKLIFEVDEKGLEELKENQDIIILDIEEYKEVTQ